MSSIQVMDAHHAALRYDNHSKPDDVTPDEPDVECHLVASYKKHSDVWFVPATVLSPREILTEYDVWLERTPSELIDDLVSYMSHAPELEIDTVSKIDAETTQKWISKTFNVSSSNDPQIDFHTMSTNAKMSQVQADDSGDLDHLLDDSADDNDDDDDTEINSFSDVFLDPKW